MRLLGIDNLPGSLHLETMELPRRVCFLFGQEGPGLSGAAREVCDGTFSIAQFGSTRSINASSAAAIAMHSWVRAYADLSGCGRLARLTAPSVTTGAGASPQRPGARRGVNLDLTRGRRHTRGGAAVPLVLPLGGEHRLRARPDRGCCGS